MKVSHFKFGMELQLLGRPARAPTICQSERNQEVQYQNHVEIHVGNFTAPNTKRSHDEKAAPFSLTCF
jgi:hypothetical protein